MSAKKDYRDVSIQKINGNTIGIVELIHSVFSYKEKIAFVKKIAKKYSAIDDFILIEKKLNNRYIMNLISPFGQEGKMCGNGIIAVLKFLRESNLKLKEIILETKAGKKQVYFVKGCYYAEVGSVHVIKKISIKNGKIKKTAFFVDVGEPHIVIIVRDADLFFSLWEKAFLRYNKKKAEFAEGVNFNVVQVFDKDKKVFVKTFERGCLRLTMSCGTGSVSAVVALKYLGIIKSDRVEIQTSGGNFWIKKQKNKYFIITKA